MPRITHAAGWRSQWRRSFTPNCRRSPSLPRGDCMPGGPRAL